MKRCPQCRKDYYDDSLAYCFDDGTPLVASQPGTDEPATAMMPQLSGASVAEKPVSDGNITQPGTRSIAVLPFVNMSADPENEYFCDGLSEELLNALAKIEDLKVAARTSTFSFKGKNTDVSEIGEKLGVKNILEGSVRKSGNRLRITVQLISAADGYHLWSERYDREMKDIFEVQDEITLAVVEALKVKLLGAIAPIEPPTRDTDAYELYLKGRSLLYQRGLSIAKAIDCFKQAVDLDPEYAQAWAGLADGYTTLGYSGYQPAVDVMPQALEAARRSLELDSNLAEGHNAFACATMFWDLDFRLAEQEFQRALELNPEYPQAIAWYGLFHLQWISGRDREGSELTRRFLELDPLSGYANTIWCFSCVSGGRIEEAVEYGRRGVDLDPKSYLAWWIFSAALQCDGQYEEAAATVEHALSISGRHSWAMMTLSAIYAGWGKPDEAKAAFRELEARSQREYIPPAMLSASAAAVGLIDRAIEFAQKGIDDRDPLLVTLSRTWPDFANLRTDPRFVKIIARLGLPGWPAS